MMASFLFLDGPVVPVASETAGGRAHASGLVGQPIFCNKRIVVHHSCGDGCMMYKNMIRY